jgi:hypothetical protein
VPHGQRFWRLERTASRAVGQEPSKNPLGYLAETQPLTQKKAPHPPSPNPQAPRLFGLIPSQVTKVISLI